MMKGLGGQEQSLMCISTCGSSLAHKQKPSVVQAIEEQKHYLTATVVLHGAVVNMAPTADCGFSAFQMYVSVCYQHLLESHEGHVPFAFLHKTMKMRMAIPIPSFSSSAKLARAAA